MSKIVAIRPRLRFGRAASPRDPDSPRLNRRFSRGCLPAGRGRPFFVRKSPRVFAPSVSHRDAVASVAVAVLVGVVAMLAAGGEGMDGGWGPSVHVAVSHTRRTVDRSEVCLELAGGTKVKERESAHERAAPAAAANPAGLADRQRERSWRKEKRPHRS